jgi:hypothetical protein
VYFGAGWICTHQEKMWRLSLGAQSGKNPEAFRRWEGSLGILHPLKRVQNDKGTCFIARKK